MKIIFPWICPSLKNSKQVFCRAWRPTVLPSKAYQEWHKEMSKLLKWITLPNKEWKYIFTYFFFIPLNKDWSEWKKWFDYSNKIESINDLLVDLWIIEDDSYKYIAEIHIYWQYVQYWEWKIELDIQ